MLSTRVFTSSSAAKNYYSHGDYYGSEGEGNWLGEGAKELGLVGKFNAKTNPEFSNLLEGKMPNGQQLARKTKDGLEHCPGVDLTFSAPKSFSIEMLIYADENEKKLLENAMTKAVNSTLKYIEENGYVVARKGHNGVIKEKINKLAFATFLHTTNRNLEPQVHIHSFLANAAKCSDGKFRSISIDKILNNNKFFGQVFRNELALETKKLGYEIVPQILSDGSSSFELAKIDNKLIRAFSTRREEIEKLFKLYNATSKEARDNIVINSRKSKRLEEPENLKEAWKILGQKVMDTIELEKSRGQKETKEIKPESAFLNSLKDFIQKYNVFKKVEKSENNSLKLEDLAMLCIEDVTHKASVFSREELYKKTLKFGIGYHTIREIDSEHKRLEKEGILIRKGDLFTSKDLLNKEKEILIHAKNALGKSSSLINEKHFSAHYEKFLKRELAKNPEFQINKEQKKVISHILLSKDKIITLEGLPGTGKSTVLNAVRDICSKKMINIHSFEGLAPTASASKNLGLSAKIEAATIHSFIGKYQGYLEGRGDVGQVNELKSKVIFVDEASLISTNIMHKLINLQKILKFRMVLVGDTKQLSAVEAGKPFEQILQIIKPVKLKEIVRQRDKLHKDAVVLASEGKVKETFKIHEKNIIVKQDLGLEATNLFLSGDKQKRDNTLLISPTKNLRDDINNNIRIGLKNENTIRGDEFTFTALRQKSMSAADYGFAPSFTEGDTLRFHKGYKDSINKDEYLKVKQINKITNSLILEKENGREIMFCLKREVDYQSKFEVFTDKKLFLQEGIRIIFTKNNKNEGLINSETALIRKIDGKNAQLQLENKLVKKINLEELKHIDYGYCVTVHSAQGKTFDNSIPAISSHPLLNEQKSWLVTLSRHRNELTVLVDNQQKLEANLTKNDGNKMAAMELVGERV